MMENCFITNYKSNVEKEELIIPDYIDNCRVTELSSNIYVDTGNYVGIQV